MSEPVFRTYDPERDRDGVARVWREVGWIDTKDHEEAMDVFLEANANRVATVDGSVESFVSSGPGRLRYLDEELPLSCITAVTTSRMARRLGLARGLLARALAEDVRRGAIVTELGMFDQGFYDRLGFGTGALEVSYTFDPASLVDTGEPRVPARLGKEDWESVHASRLARRRLHGSVNIARAAMTRAEMMWSEHGFGFGYHGEDGTLSHHAWVSTKDVESGPYSLWWTSFRTREELLELLAVVRSWSDQVPLVRFREPPGIHFQDLLRRPFRSRMLTKDGKYAVRVSAGAYSQVRILDLAACIEHTHLEEADVSFNLALHDPIRDHLPPDNPWPGLSGDYVVTLGRSSTARHGTDAKLPRLRASIGAFSRLWLGARSASSLAWTDDLDGPPELLRALDRSLRLPAPHPDWDF
ncbi:MAG: GNAT family N-acetyltransferase [Candidatus Bipolaricaulota bacterium]|nr:MAG: GNAT family N-acetyltransferase [Candidatus Bipolaricaulota bacterium]